MDDEFISISAAAKAIGLNKSTLSRQVNAGQIRSQDGKVKLSQVLEDRASNIDASIWEYRKKRPDASSQSSAADPLHATEATLHATGSVLHATLGGHDEEIDDDTEELLVDGGIMPIGKAKAMKETYLARLRKLEFEVESKRLVDADTVRKKVFELSRQDRDSWTNWPARVAPLIAAELGVDQVALAVILEKHVRDHLTERAQPTLRLAS